MVTSSLDLAKKRGTNAKCLRVSPAVSIMKLSSLTSLDFHRQEFFEAESTCVQS
jgi:hypothetical protein